MRAHQRVQRPGIIILTATFSSCCAQTAVYKVWPYIITNGAADNYLCVVK